MQAAHSIRLPLAHALYGARHLTQDQTIKLHLLTLIVDVDAYEISLGVIMSAPT